MRPTGHVWAADGGRGRPPDRRDSTSGTRASMGAEYAFRDPLSSGLGRETGECGGVSSEGWHVQQESVLPGQEPEAL